MNDLEDGGLTEKEGRSNLSMLLKYVLLADPVSFTIARAASTTEASSSRNDIIVCATRPGRAKRGQPPTTRRILREAGANGAPKTANEESRGFLSPCAYRQLDRSLFIAAALSNEGLPFNYYCTSSYRKIPMWQDESGRAMMR